MIYYKIQASAKELEGSIFRDNINYPERGQIYSHEQLFVNNCGYISQDIINY